MLIPSASYESYIAMKIATKKVTAPTYLASAIPSTTLAFDTITEMRAALKRVATFALVGSKNRPLLSFVLTDSEIARVEAAREAHLDAGKPEMEFVDSPKIWSDGIDPIWLPTVTNDVERILASLIDLDNGNADALKSWNLQVNGYTVSCRKVLGAVAGEKGSKLTLKGIVAACK